MNVKGVDFTCLLWGFNKDEAVNRLDNSVLDNKALLQMHFGANKTPVEIIKEGALGGTCFGGIYSGINGK